VERGAGQRRRQRRRCRRVAGVVRAQGGGVRCEAGRDASRRRRPRAGDAVRGSPVLWASTASGAGGVVRSAPRRGVGARTARVAGLPCNAWEQGVGRWWCEHARAAAWLVSAAGVVVSPGPACARAFAWARPGGGVRGEQRAAGARDCPCGRVRPGQRRAGAAERSERACGAERPGAGRGSAAGRRTGAEREGAERTG